MDAFEAVRSAAARLHDELVGSGIDPLDPAKLIDAAIDKLELELYRLPPGDPALKGARALYDDQSGSICCEETTDPGDGVLLIAHELGHACVHTASSCCSSSDVDASRATEASPVGIQRVEDYGVKERRELQANVFARELVFPRALARRLFVEETMSASRIARAMGLPLNVVRQQLFDALLLPPAPPEEERPAPTCPPRPDPSQERAAEHRGTPFQLQAGPGTGKTRTLVKTVVSLLEEGVHPAAILVLTYSNRAAGELSERIAAATGDHTTKIWIGTFHAFGLDLLRRYHDRLGLPSRPVLFDKSDAIEVLQELLPTLPLVHYRNLWDPVMVLRDIVAAISRAKDELTGPERYRQLAQAMLVSAADAEARQAAEKCLEVAQVYELYEKSLAEHGAIDFGDLIMRPALLLEADASLRSEVQLRHRHVLVDEYQDVNRASTRLLKSLAGDGKRLWVVGDARQSIYRFRGASSINMMMFGQEYPNARADQLSVSYRSTKRIVDTVVAIAPNMGASAGMLPLALVSDRGDEQGCVQVRRYDSVEQEAEGVAASIRELEERGVRLREQAVLCRTNPKLREIAAALEARGIPVLHLGSLFEREEVRDLLALMSLAVDPLGDGLARVTAMPRYGVPLQDLYVAIRWLRESGRFALEALPELAQAAGLSPEGVAGFSRLAADFRGVTPGTSPWEFLSRYLLDGTEVIRQMASSDSVASRMKSVAVWQFLNFVREQSPSSAGPPMRRVLDRVRQLVLLAEERDLREVPAAALHMNAVRLMTVHGSKGLEFEAVHVPGLTVASFPTSYRPHRCPAPVGMIEGSDLSVVEEARRSHENEEECLFFVAVSRARTHFILHLSRRTPAGKNRTPSPYLGWVGAYCEEVLSPITIPLPPDAPRPAPIMVIRPDDWHVTDSQLRSYEKCPRRYFYTHVLGLGGARKTTAFSQTHDCIYELISWLGDARRESEPTLDAAEAAFERIWLERGPATHPYAADYRRLASRLITALLKAAAGRRFRESEPIALDFPSGKVVVEPNEIAELPDGAVLLRRVNTGHKRSDEMDRLQYSLYHLAGQLRYGKRCFVEAVYLSNDAVEVASLTNQRIKGKSEKSGAMLASIAAGWYLPEVDSVACPRCPHFFICDSVPRGPLTIA